ncbi:methyl-accepting chemotaxis protein [Rhodopseudomonas parapalustris]
MAISVLSGGIDLSVGAVFAMADFLTLYLLMVREWPLPLAIVAVLAWGALIGAVNGGLIAYAKTRPFLTTMVVLIILRAAYNKLTGLYAIDLASASSDSEAWDYLGTGYLFGIPINMVFLIVVGLIGHLYLTRIRSGVHIMAVGSSRKAARHAGIDVKRSLFLAYVLAGMLASFAGILYAARQNNRSLKARMTTLVAMQAMIMTIIGAAGIYAVHGIDARLKTVFEDRAVSLQQLSEINNRMLDNGMALRGAVIRAKAGQPVGGVSERVSKNVETITKLFNEYMATYLTPEEKQFADSFAGKRRAYVEEAIRPGVALLEAGKIDELGGLVIGKARETFDAAKSDLDKLIALQMRVAKEEYDAGQSEYAIMLAVSLGLLALGLLLGILNGLFTTRAITVPLGRLNAVMDNIAQGKFDSRVEIDRDDEAGVALRNLQAMQNKLFFNREEEKDTAKRAAHQRKLDMQRIASEFESAVGEVIQTVSSASTELEASATTLSSSAQRAQEVTTSVAAASEQATTNVQSVASASEEMTSSVNEISRQVQESARIAREAVVQAHTTNERVGDLSTAAARIGDVVELINTIAGQTNLLALNATIEAARAGDAGRGFAVVAAEVKALAEQTAKATGEISQQIGSIQTATGQSVTAIQEIGATISRMSEIAATIASAVEEQGAATQEISRNVQQAAQGTQEVSASIIDVQRGATETGAASNQVLSAAQSLARDSNRLKDEVGLFLQTVRSA